MTVEQQQQKDAYANRRIGQVKDRTEKDELLSSPHRNPFGQHRLISGTQFSFGFPLLNMIIQNHLYKVGNIDLFLRLTVHDFHAQ